MPSMLDRRTYSKFGEHGVHREHRERGKDVAYQPDDLNTLFVTQNTLFVTQNTLFGNQMT